MVSSQRHVARLLPANVFFNSRTRRFLQLHQRVQESQRLSESTFPAANLRRFHVHRGWGRCLSLRRQQGFISSTRLCRKTRIEDRLRHCHPYGLPVVQIPMSTY